MPARWLAAANTTRQVRAGQVLRMDLAQLPPALMGPMPLLPLDAAPLGWFDHDPAIDVAS